VTNLKTNGEDVIPSDIKTLIKTGKVSTKKMPKSQFYELYQDYICSCALRVSREIFAVLPTAMVIVNANGELLNSKTGHMEECTLLSVAIPRETIEKLNIDAIDPSDSLSNFVHNMSFKKTSGFGAVEKLTPADFQSTIQR
jgi:hypothetical protein